jgi:hypothetical protein
MAEEGGFMSTHWGTPKALARAKVTYFNLESARQSPFTVHKHVVKEVTLSLLAMGARNLEKITFVNQTGAYIDQKGTIPVFKDGLQALQVFKVSLVLINVAVCTE